MTSRAASKNASRTLSVLLAGIGMLAVSALLTGCCTSHEEDVCGLMDYSQASCPSQQEFSNMLGGEEVKSGPEEKYYVDFRKDVVETPAYGAYGRLCCYRVEYQSCGNIKLGYAY